MRRAALARPSEEGLSILDSAPYAHLAWVDDGGQPQLRSVHAVRHGSHAVFHGAKASRQAQNGRTGTQVVLQAQQVLAEIPSYFVDPEMACPATTFYRSVQIEGQLESVDDPDEKASALQAIMEQFQPEGGYIPIRPGDERYRKNVRGVAVTRLVPERVSVKANVGQSRPLEQRTQLVEALWNRGQPTDLEAIEWIRGATAEDPAPKPWTGATSLHVSAPREDAAAVAQMLEGTYWNTGVERSELEAAHRASSAWVVARDSEQRIVASARAISDDRKHAWIYDVIVRPEVRRRGLALRLLRLLLDHPRVRSTRQVHLATRDAQPLYRKLGFEDGSGSIHPEMVLRTRLPEEERDEY